MSKETMEWLNNNILRGFTEKYGNAWWFDASVDNHYPGAIPLKEISRRLFWWEPVVIDRPCGCACGAVSRDITHPETHHRFGTFTDGYMPHSYNEWLVGSLSNIIGDTLQVSSAGLLQKGAIAWVQVEAPESITVEGVEFRPHILATTSLDGSIATTFKRTHTFTQCDNTRDRAMREGGQTFKVKHTRHSSVKIDDAREALKIIQESGDSMAAEIADLVATTVTDRQWSQFLDAYVPVPEETGRGRTIAENKREQLTELWNSDHRAAPWHGTAYGVLAATNTYLHHYATVKGADHRAERNMLNVLKGRTDAEDRKSIDVLDKVLAAA